MRLRYSVLEPHFPHRNCCHKAAPFLEGGVHPVRHGNLAMLCFEAPIQFLLARRRPVIDSDQRQSRARVDRSRVERRCGDAPFEIA